MGSGEGAKDLLVEEREGGVEFLDEHGDAALHACGDNSVYSVSSRVRWCGVAYGNVVHGDRTGSSGVM
jgi:hypothetical protein